MPNFEAIKNKKITWKKSTKFFVTQLKTTFNFPSKKRNQVESERTYLFLDRSQYQWIVKNNLRWINIGEYGSITSK